MKVKLFRILGIIVVCMLIMSVFSGCGVDKAANKVATNYYELLKSGDFTKTLDLCSDKMFEETSKDEFLDILNGIKEKLGSLQTYEQVSWKINKTAGSWGNGTYVTFEYEVTYSKPASSTETLTLFKSVTDDEYQIIGYYINSKDLIK